MTDELKNCPFCGGAAELKHTPGSYGYYPGSWGVVCSRCNIQTKSFVDETWEQGKGHRSVSAEAKALAAAAWNRRNAHPSPIPAAEE